MSRTITWKSFIYPYGQTGYPTADSLVWRKGPPVINRPDHLSANAHKGWFFSLARSSYYRHLSSMLAKREADPGEPAIHAFVTKWVSLLAQGLYQKAYDSVLQNNEQTWTPQLMERVVNGYGVPHQEGQPKFAVTPPETALGSGDGFEILWFDRHSAVNLTKDRKRLAEVWCQLPLNNEWSDLTVTFDLVKCPDGFYLELKDIHVH